MAVCSYGMLFTSLQHQKYFFVAVVGFFLKNCHYLLLIFELENTTSINNGHLGECCGLNRRVTYLLSTTTDKILEKNSSFYVK